MAGGMHGKLIHPMYVVLQEESPMSIGPKKKYSIAEVDTEKYDMMVEEFYHDYVSKSLPVVFRKEAKGAKLT